MDKHNTTTKTATKGFKIRKQTTRRGGTVDERFAIWGQTHLGNWKKVTDVSAMATAEIVMARYAKRAANGECIV